MPIICGKCMKVFHEHGDCPHCGAKRYRVDFRNNDKFLKKAVQKVRRQRKEANIEGMVGDLNHIVINVEPDYLELAVQELIGYTGHDLVDSFKHKGITTAVLTCENSADILVTAGKQENAFAKFNQAPKASKLPNTRLETFVFKTKGLDNYHSIQKERGVHFLTDLIDGGDHKFVQTIPSDFTGISIGYIEGNGYRPPEAEDITLDVLKPDRPYLRNISRLDHTASRVQAADRDAAMIEFMELTDYDFKFAIYVKSMNSITNVTRLAGPDFAMVFTSGISPYVDDKSTGPTEKFIHNYGPRTHHMAFDTVNIEETFEGLENDGMEFLLGLIGSPEEGLKQTFSEGSPNTMLVNEYIHRYGDFDGFFTRSNVTDLTASTDKQ